MRKHPQKSTPPTGYADAKIACYILGISRRQLDRLADTGKIKRIISGWHTYFALDSVLLRRDAKKITRILSPSPKTPTDAKMSPEQ